VAIVFDAGVVRDSSESMGTSDEKVKPYCHLAADCIDDHSVWYFCAFPGCFNASKTLTRSWRAF
jgi:hypothetical protein